MIFKCEAQGDKLFIQAVDLDAARQRLTELMGVIPESLLTWTVVQETDVPEGEELL